MASETLWLLRQIRRSHRRWVILSGLIAVVTALSDVEASGVWRTRRYEVPSVGVIAPGIPSDRARDGRLDIGGVTFPALGGTGRSLVQIKVVDDRSKYVSVSLCQQGSALDSTCVARGNSHVGITGPPIGQYCMRSGSSALWWWVLRDRPMRVDVDAVAVCASIPFIPIPYFRGIAHATSGAVFLRQY